MEISRFDYFMMFRLVPLGMGGLMLFGAIGQSISDPIGCYIGAPVGFLLGAWLAWKGMPPA
jgi:hypothetical protein